MGWRELDLNSLVDEDYSGMCVNAWPPMKSAAAISECSEGKGLPLVNALVVFLIDFCSTHSTQDVN
jgi:hypothetical protein